MIRINQMVLQGMPFTHCVITTLIPRCRFITVCQVLVFFMTCIARAVQHLTITTFELTTVAFVFAMLGTSICWWYKPKDVGRPIILRTDISTAEIRYNVRGFI